MSKVICDICGTTYPDTAECCPICGYARDAELQVLSEEAEAEPVNVAPKADTVKGGKFSHANVRKRHQSAAAFAAEPEDDYDEPEDTKEPKKKSNAVLIILLVVLIIALLAVGGYILFTYYLPNLSSDADATESTSASEDASSEALDTITEETTIPCEALELLSSETVELTREGQYHLVNTQKQPLETTDEVTYFSDNEAVATVDSDGRICAVGEGEAIITIKCGSQEVQCRVVVVLETEPTEESTEETEATEETEETQETEETEPSGETEATEEGTEATDETEEPTEEIDAVGVVVIVLDKYDVTFHRIGTQFTLTYTPTEIPLEEVVWTTNNSSVCTVVNGVITTRGYGVATITAEYQGITSSCIVRVVKN